MFMNTHTHTHIYIYIYMYIYIFACVSMCVGGSVWVCEREREHVCAFTQTTVNCKRVSCNSFLYHTRMKIEIKF